MGVGWRRMEKGKKWEDYNKEPGPGIGGIIPRAAFRLTSRPRNYEQEIGSKCTGFSPPLF